MLRILLTSLGLLAGLQACDPCCRDAVAYTTHLEDVMVNRAPASSVCGDVQLMSRIQVIPDWMTTIPESLSKYGNYWVFASDNGVLDKFLELAEAEPDRADMLAEMMFHVGFDNASLNYDSEYSMVVFDQAAMEDVWETGPIDVLMPIFQPTWEALVTYLRGEGLGFQVCSSANHEPGEECHRSQLEISPETQTVLEITDYTELTGCPKGFAHFLEERDTRACPCSDKYCSMLAELSTDAIREGGTPRCVTHFKANPSNFDTVLWTRAFFETCMACNAFFTGKGVGYNPEAGVETGAEWIVRGDSQAPIEDLKASRAGLWP